MRLQGRVDRPWRFFSIGIVLMIGVLFFADWRDFQASSKQADEARQFVRQTNLVMSSVKDAETGEFGFLLTGDGTYLARYEAAVKALPAELRDLDATAQAAHRNVTQVARIRMLIEEKLSEFGRAIGVRETEGEAAVLDLVRKDGGWVTMDEVRTACSVLTSGEAVSLFERTRLSEKAANKSRAVVLAGCLALVVLLFRLGAVTDAVVTEREEFAKTIDDSRQLLQTTLASIGDAVIVTDSADLVRFMNSVAESLTGWSALDAEREPLDKVFRVIREGAPAAVSEDDVGNSANTFIEHRALVAKNGLRVPIDQSSAPIRDTSSATLGTVLVFRDISARREAERELERWKEIFSGAGFGLFVIDPSDGALVDMNPTFASMHGYSVDQLQGSSLAALGANGFREELAAAIQAARRDGRHMFEHTHIRRDGSEFAALIDMTTFHDHGKEYRAGYCADITERKQFEDTLRESEERFRTLASALPQMIWSTDRGGRTEYVNDGWRAYAGAPGENPWSGLLYPDDREPFLARWNESLSTGHVFEAQARIRRNDDGTTRWFLCRAVAVRDREGVIVRWLGGCTDVQQQVENASQLKRANEALRRSNDDLEQFAYAASHDLQEPLRMVSIYSELLREEYRASLDERAISYIDFAVNGAQRMSSLLKALLRYSRVTDAPAEAPRFADATAALSGALLNLATVIQDARAVIDTEPLPLVAAPEIHVAQLFQNLVGNALKYRRDTYPEGECPSVRIGAERQPGNWWLFSVRDNGIGIEPEYLTQIFGLFKRLHGDSFEGTGIGLALCQKIVERAGGSIWAESTPGEGSTFFFTLPGVETES